MVKKIGGWRGNKARSENASVNKKKMQCAENCEEKKKRNSGNKKEYGDSENKANKREILEMRRARICMIVNNKFESLHFP